MAQSLEYFPDLPVHDGGVSVRKSLPPHRLGKTVYENVKNLLHPAEAALYAPSTEAARLCISFRALSPLHGALQEVRRRNHAYPLARFRREMGSVAGDQVVCPG